MTTRSTGVPRGAAHDDASAEAALMSRIAAGDRELPMIELYDRYATPVYRLGLGLLGDGPQAEELVQETFLRLWRSAPRFDPEQSSVRSFIFLLARRGAVDAHRRRAARPVTSGEVEPDDHPAPEPVADEMIERIAIGVEVREALDGMPAKYREVLELGYDQQLTQLEIADRLDIPLGTVKSRTYHALRAMRLELDRRAIRG